jgi:hypothetical protein
MNQNTGNSTQVVALIKFFSKEEHFLAFKSGYSLFRTPHFFRQDKSPGRGDRSESCLGYWDKAMGDEMPSIVMDGHPVDMKDAKSVLIYPAHEPKDSWLQSWCVIGPHNRFEGSIEQMLEKFGIYFVVLPAKNISKYAELLSQVSGSQVSCRLIQYSNNPLESSLTVKNSTLGYQKEFRFYTGECGKDEVEEKKFQLGGLESILLEATSLKLQSPFGETKYCSLGQKQVVTA